MLGAAGPLTHEVVKVEAGAKKCLKGIFYGAKTILKLISIRQGMHRQFLPIRSILIPHPKQRQLGNKESLVSQPKSILY
jgi:hypothetical protein